MQLVKNMRELSKVTCVDGSRLVCGFDNTNLLSNLVDAKENLSNLVDASELLIATRNHFSRVGVYLHSS